MGFYHTNLHVLLYHFKGRFFLTSVSFTYWGEFNFLYDDLNQYKIEFSLINQLHESSLYFNSHQRNPINSSDNYQIITHQLINYFHLPYIFYLSHTTDTSLHLFVTLRNMLQNVLLLSLLSCYASRLL